MSEWSTEADPVCTTRAHPCPAVRQILQPASRDLGEFSVRRVLPTRSQRSIGPWIFFDHMGPACFQPGQGVNVRPHPHINLATVTYLFEGEILHRDSLGSEQVITPGAINLMVAGSGIVHSERERPEVRDSVHALNGLQLWFALPEADEECAPAFLHYPAGDIPATEVDAVRVRVLIGSAYGVASPVLTFSPTLYLEAFLAAGQALVLPEADERGLYLVSGSVEIDGVALAPGQMAVLSEHTKDAVVKALTEAQVALIGGSPLGARFMDWNFASSRRERIDVAREDWRKGRFASVPGDDAERIPYPGDD